MIDPAPKRCRVFFKLSKDALEQGTVGCWNEGLNWLNLELERYRYVPTGPREKRKSAGSRTVSS